MGSNSTSGLIIRMALVMIIMGAVVGYAMHVFQIESLDSKQLKEIGKRLKSSNILDIMFTDSSSKPHTALGKEDDIIVPGIRKGNHLFVRVELNDFKEVTLLVDTGASHIALTSDVAYDLGLLESESQEVTFNTANGQAQAFVTELDSIRVGDAVQYQVLASFGKNLLGVGDGLLGMSFLKHYIANVNLDREELHLQPRDY